MKYLCLLILFTLMCIYTVAPELHAEDKLPKILSIQADFKQEKHLKILRKPLISTGKFIFQAPQSLRWEYYAPVPSVLIMDKGTVEKYIKRDGEWVADEGMNMDGMQMILGEITNWLDGRFRENDLFKVSFPDQQTVLMKPRNSSPEGPIDHIELKVAEQRNLLESVTIVEGVDAFTKMTFSNRLLNRDISASAFSIK